MGISESGNQKIGLGKLELALSRNIPAAGLHGFGKSHLRVRGVWELGIGNWKIGIWELETGVIIGMKRIIPAAGRIHGIGNIPLGESGIWTWGFGKWEFGKWKFGAWSLELGNVKGKLDIGVRSA